MAAQFRWILAAGVMLVGCGFPGPEEPQMLARPILNGTVDVGHPAVGLLMVNGEPWCTSTLIGSRTVLTAVHCVVRQKQPPYSITDQFGWSPDNGVTNIPAASVAFHPSYARTTTPVSLTNDVAVVRLTKDVPNIQPMRIASTAPVMGEQITLVGYGYTADGATETFGTKRKTVNTIGKVTATDIVFYGATGAVGNICNGDSGGPAFAQRNGEEVLVGVHSWGEAACGVAEHDQRADAYYSWIKEQAQGNLYEGPTGSGLAPQVQIVAPTFNAQVGPSFQVLVTAQVASGLARVELTLDGALLGSLQQPPYTFTVSSASPGSHALQADAIDQAGHRNSTRIIISVVGQNDGNQSPSDPGASPGGPAADNPLEVVGGCTVARGQTLTPPLLPALLLLGLLGVVVRRRARSASLRPARLRLAMGRPRRACAAGVPAVRRDTEPWW